MTRLPDHRLATLFPLIEGDEFDALVADVRANGVRQPIWLYEGRILDGRNRYRAAKVAKIECPSKVYRGKDPLGFVISLNLKRRHLNESQRADAAAKLANMPQGARTDLQHPANLPNVDQPTAAALLNVSERSLRDAKAVRDNGNTTPELQHAVEQGHLAVSVAAKVCKLPPTDQRQVAAMAERGEINVARKVAKQKLRAQHERQLATKLCALPDRKYGVIYADPEWRFETYSEAGLDLCSAANHYPTSTLEEIKVRDVASIAASECILFLWATVPMLPQALEVMTVWGFQYVSSFCWIKNKTGTGYWNFNKHEILLVGTRGNVPAPAPGTQWPSAIEAPVGKHSAKPEKFLELIEAYFPTLPKIELNRRGPARRGWDAWAAEASQTTLEAAE